ncbi:MAG: exodeoxyribonuclease VII large subunit, partial [Chloroflexota bacterium]
VLGDLWISGEVANCTRARSGHNYFTLRDAESALRCVMFRGGRGDEFLGDGAQVLAHGRVSMYTVRGDLQFYVDHVRPEGIGALQQAFEQLKQRLEAEGLFSPDRKRPLPRFPQRIGVITSPTGAAVQDILNVLRRRYPLAEVVLAPTLVQGEQAAPAIVDAIQTVNAEAGIDVMIVARGGGSLEDLWPFNEESVARAIFASSVPVISGVGHETDVTITDLVADLRAPTPSAAAEQAAPDRVQLANTVASHVNYLQRTLSRMLEDQRSRLELARDRLAARGPDTRQERRNVDELLRRAGAAVKYDMDARRERLRSLEAQLHALDPHSILSRGYAVVRNRDTDEVMTAAGQVGVGDPLAISFADGEVEAEARERRETPDGARIRKSGRRRRRPEP